jgi:peptidoglycan-associated lipoprotein
MAEAKPLATGNADVESLFPPKGQGGALGQRSIYYEFDKYNVKDEYTPIAVAHAGFLSKHSKARVTLQGNCDERGSREYNLALGSRRADGVKSVMVTSGASVDQIEVVSFGKEKPQDAGHDEAAWAKNRRVDIVYQGE